MTLDLSGKPQIAIARGAMEKKEIFRFRYRVLVDELHQSPDEADHDKKALRDSLDDTAIHMYMTVDGKVIASVRLNLVKLSPVPDELRQAYALDRFDAFPGDKISLTSQLMISEKWRKSSVPAVLLGATYKLARQQGILLDFCHCAPYLVPLYEQLGYRRYTDNFVDKTAGYVMPLVLLTEDIDYLKACRSPFFKLAAQYRNDGKTAAWFLREFPDRASETPRGGLTDDDFWRLLTDKLHQIPLISIPLLKGLTYEEAKSFLKVGTVLQSREGDMIVRVGDIGNEMFVLLAGAVEVRMVDGAGNEHVLCTLGQGEVFGEVAFLSTTPRSANVVALADCEVLVLTQQFFEKVMESMPAITAKVLFNMALILCERLKTSNESWMAAVGDAPPTETPEIAKAPVQAAR